MSFSRWVMLLKEQSSALGSVLALSWSYHENEHPQMKIANFRAVKRLNSLMKRERERRGEQSSAQRAGPWSLLVACAGRPWRAWIYEIRKLGRREERRKKAFFSGVVMGLSVIFYFGGKEKSLGLVNILMLCMKIFSGLRWLKNG